MQFDKIENLLSLLLFHSRMLAEICEDALTFNLYRGVLFTLLYFLQYQFCEIDYRTNNMVSILIVSFLNACIETSLLVYKKIHKYKSTHLTQRTLTLQFATIGEFSNHYLLRRCIKIFGYAIFDVILFFLIIHFLLQDITTSSGYTISNQLLNYIEQYLALSVVPGLRIIIEY